jgi:HEPN domain-containing protein
MPHDPELVAETRAWLTRARDDIRLAELIRTSDLSLAGNALFHCQQSAERSLKAVLTWHGRTLRKTHSITELGVAIEDASSALAILARRSAFLTDYAWKFRYPGDVVEPAPGEVDEALLAERDLYEAVLAELPVQVLP